MNKKQAFTFVGLLVAVFASFIFINSLDDETITVGVEVTDTDVDQTTEPDTVDTTDEDPTDLLLDEVMIAPVESNVYEVLRKFYDVNSSAQEQEESVISYSGTGYTVFISCMGTSFEDESGDDFNVVSIFSGEVVDVRENPLLNNIIEIEHENGVVSYYYSVTDIKVSIGDYVAQGDIIAVSSYSVLDSALGSHVYLEVKKDNYYINPESFIGEKLVDFN